MCCLWAHAEDFLVKAGDIIEINGVKAIVFQTNDEGNHGKAMSVKAFRGIDSPWCKSSKYAKDLYGTSNTEDGRQNTDAVLEYARSRGLLPCFPVFEWCSKLGNEWYIPSLKELEGFINFWLGNEEVLNWDEDEEIEMDNNKPFFKIINEKMLEAGGIPFINGVYTSTVNEEGKVYVFYYNRIKNTWALKQKSRNGLGRECVGRAFIKF